MKKNLLLFAATLFCSVGAFAQWVKPTLPVPETVAMDLTDVENVAEANAYYLYNVEANSFYGHANNWNTRASLVSAPQDYFCVEHNKTVTSGAMMVKLVKDLDTEGYGIMWVKEDGGTDYTSPDGWNGIWVDGKRTNYNEFSITPTSGNNFTIGCNAVLQDGLLGVLSTDPSSMPMVNLYVPGEVSGATLYSTWALVTPEAYAAARPEELVAKYQEDVKPYNAAVSLKKALDAAKSEYPTLDFSAPQAVYDNTSSTVEELEAAEFQVTVIINDYKSGLATFDNPADLTDQIGDGSDVGPWTREFTGSGKVGDWHTNTWSNEATRENPDGTDMIIPFCEDWVANGSLLSDQKIYKVLKNCAPGLYVFDANVRLFNEKGDQDALTGCTMYFGDDQVDISSQVDMYKWGNACVLWKKGGFRLVTVLKETGDIEVGFDIKNATFNWLAFKDTKLMYYGNEDADAHAVELYKEGYSYEEIDDETYAKESLVSAYNDAVKAYDAATNLDDLRAAIKSINESKEVMEENHKAYEGLLAKIEEWKKDADENELNGADWDAFVEFVQGTQQGGYPAPTPAEIYDDGDRSLTTEEIADYITKVDELYSYAVSHSLTEGSDCTGMLVNPNFADANGKGWTWDKGTADTINKRGGNAEFWCAEAYAGWDSNNGFLFNVYQDVVDVPDGIYQISANCFYRWADNGGFTGEEIVPAVIYMNDFESPVQHIASGALQYDELWTKNEEGADVLQSGWYGSWANNDGIGYVPNDMSSASCAFSKDMYKQTVYGLVEGGKMRIGIKKETKTTENRHWCLWTNFKLTFMDKNDDAVSAIVADLSTSLEALTKSELAESVDDDLLEQAEDLMTKAYDAETLTAEERYQLMKDLNECIKEIKSEAEGYKDAADALQKLYDAVNDAYGLDEYNDDPNYAAIVDDIAEWQDEMQNKVDEKTLAKEEMDGVITGASDRIARLGIKGDWEKASEEYPVDLTALIVNPDFSTGNINGWVDTYTQGNHGYQSNNKYGDGENHEEPYCDQFVEAWRSGNVALDNGSISQTIDELGFSFLTALPAGNYILMADINAQNQGDASLTGGLFLYATNANNVYQTEVETTKTDEGTVVRTNQVKFTVSESDRKVEIGIKTVDTPYNWFAADNFKLIYLGAGEPVTPSETAIAEIMSKNNGRTIFDLTGRQVSKAVKGIYIINGKKVVVK